MPGELKLQGYRAHDPLAGCIHASTGLAREATALAHAWCGSRQRPEASHPILAGCQAAAATPVKGDGIQPAQWRRTQHVSTCTQPGCSGYL